MIGVLWLCLSPLPVAAACTFKVHYGSAAVSTTYSSTRWLASGASATFDRDWFRRLDNTGAYDVRVDVRTLLGPANHKVGSGAFRLYPDQPKLSKVTCLTTTSSSYQDFARLLKDSGASARAIAQEVRQIFNIGLGDMLRLLKALGFALPDLHEVARQVYGASVETTVNAMRLAGFTIDEVMEAFRHVLADPGEFSTGIFRAVVAGFGGFSQIVVKNVHRGIMRWLTGSLREMRQGDLLLVALETGDAAGGFLVLVEITTSTVDAKLSSILRRCCGGSSVAIKDKASDALLMLLRQGPSGLWDAAKVEVARAKVLLVESGGTLAGSTVEALGRWLRAARSTLAPAELAQILRGAGYRARDVARGLRAAFDQGLSATLSALQAARFAAADLADVGRSIFRESAQQVAGVLRTLRYGEDTVRRALESAGYPAAEVASALPEVFGAR